MQPYTFFKLNALNPICRHMLRYHRSEGELRVIQRTLEAILNNWLLENNSEKTKTMNAILSKSVWDDTSIFNSLPIYIQNLIRNPKKLLPSLDKRISNSHIHECIRSAMQNCLDGQSL